MRPILWKLSRSWVLILGLPHALPSAFGQDSGSSDPSIVAMENIDSSWLCGPGTAIDAYWPGDGNGNIAQPPPGGFGTVALVHGGGWEWGDKVSFDGFAQKMAANQQALAFSVEYPLHNTANADALTQNGTNPWAVSPAVTMGQEVSAVDCVTSAVQMIINAYPNLLNGRMVMVGASAGGHLVQQLGLNQGNSRPVAVVSVSGPADLTDPAATSFDQFLIDPGNPPTPWVSDAERRAYSPLYNVNQNVAPMMLMAAQDDSLVPPDIQTAPMCQALGSQCTPFIVATGGHCLVGGWFTQDSQNPAWPAGPGYDAMMGYALAQLYP